mgnify:CR=1 FL=1
MSANYLKQAYLLAVVVCHVNNPGQRSHLAAITLCIRWAEGIVCPNDQALGTDWARKAMNAHASGLSRLATMTQTSS